MTGVARHAPESREDNRIPGRAVVKRLEGSWLGLTAWHCCVILVLAAFAAAQLTPAAAASDAADPMTTLLEQARANGLRVIILEPGDDVPEPGDATTTRSGFGQTMTDLAGRLVAHLEPTCKWQISWP